MKSIDNIKAKIQKLFAMADPAAGASPAEVESALTAARKLICKYKLSEADLEIKKETKIITKVFSDISFTTQRNPWIAKLVNTIGPNYCCHGVLNTMYGAKTKQAAFIGFEDDVELAGNVLKYAVNSAFSEHKHIESKMRKQGYSFHDITSAKNAWGNGYVRGIQEAFEKQNLEEATTSSSFAMVMVEPKDVKDYVHNTCSKTKFNTTNATRNARAFDRYAVEGYKQGCEFNMKTKLKG